jgi:hypothetical protein
LVSSVFASAVCLVATAAMVARATLPLVAPVSALGLVAAAATSLDGHGPRAWVCASALLRWWGPSVPPMVLKGGAAFHSSFLCVCLDAHRPPGGVERPCVCVCVCICCDMRVCVCRRASPSPCAPSSSGAVSVCWTCRTGRRTGSAGSQRPRWTAPAAGGGAVPQYPCTAVPVVRPAAVGAIAATSAVCWFVGLCHVFAMCLRCTGQPSPATPQPAESDWELQLVSDGCVYLVQATHPHNLVFFIERHRPDMYWLRVRCAGQPSQVALRLGITAGMSWLHVAATPC